MRILITISLLFLTANLFGGELVLKGVYRGKDIYVKNPYNKTSQSFCTLRVLVNDNTVVENPKVSAFKIDLSHLNFGGLVIIRIEHVDGCTPQIINPQVLSVDNSFKFVVNQASNNSIDWTTQGENAVGTFVIEQEIYHPDKTITWEELKRVPGKGGLTMNSYSIAPAHFPGENNYRIRYDSPERESVYSVLIKYTSTKTPITFYPVSVTTKITLSEPTIYQISDRNGRVIKSGSGSSIQCQELRPGEYFLHIQNRVEKFVKK